MIKLLINNISRFKTSFILLVLVLLFPTRGEIFPCACCSNLGERFDSEIDLDSRYVDIFEQLRFDSKAFLFLGEKDPESVTDIHTASVEYKIKVTWKKSRFVFEFQDLKNHSGTLTVELPKKISVFYVDDINSTPSNTQPLLYKEFRIMSKMIGTGIFAPVLEANQFITLILRGRGNLCHNTHDFIRWTLVIQGPKSNYHLFGTLIP
ncbi:hypothetical protein [Leptospira noguchii]|uniref:hypothetical protein n=1 Tax=Leptospira noguchii TaxID=28182 RepID=UPI000774BA00|nr:hypothetical protein [Leptospira noguchii]